MRKKIVGIMGPGNPSDSKVLKQAYKLGSLVAKNNWVLLTGGRNAGVMDLASQGASESGGLVIGILPDSNNDNCSNYVDIAIPTGMGSARNNINILASDMVIACGMGAGTASEVSLALKSGKRVILINVSQEAQAFFQQISMELVIIADTVDDVVDRLKENLL